MDGISTIGHWPNRLEARDVYLAARKGTVVVYQWNTEVINHIPYTGKKVHFQKHPCEHAAGLATLGQRGNRDKIAQWFGGWCVGREI